MKYASASITAHYEGQQAETVDLEDVDSENALVDHLWALWFCDTPFGDEDEPEADDTPDRDRFAGNITFTDPQGFAVHLFKEHTHADSTHRRCSPVANFDDILEVWSNESDDDRREAMGEYLDDMGADDLSDFDEAYNGQYKDGAEFAEQLADDLGAVSEENARWIVIDWEATWDMSLRHDYHITANGHVFRHL